MGRHSAREVWDESKHPRGPGGKFAEHGRLSIRAPEGSGRPGRNRTDIGRAANAFKPRSRSESEARDRYNAIADHAGDVRNAYEAVRRGTATYRQRENISYQSPRKRDESRARTGDVIMPFREAISRELSGKRRDSREPRIATKTTFTGRKRLVRGRKVPAGARPTGEARRVMALGR